MKRLLLLLLLSIGASNMRAQDCIGYIPENAIVLCDTFTILQSNNNYSYWVTNDTAAVSVRGNNDTLYYTGYRNHVAIANIARNNVIYMQGFKTFALIQGNSNTLYMNGVSNLILFGDSNIVYGKNIEVYFSASNNNLVIADTINILGDTGLNNITDTNSVCSSIQISTQNAPPNPCAQTIGIIENIASIDVYPNPSTDNVTFSLQNAGEIKTITIYDIAGKTIEVIANINANKATIDTSKLSTGIYVYSITLANGKTQRGKLLVG
ncbi:MAG: T9SS type A sorting domain-containing protein [Sphingobacteriales bacterium JAD_PAG50586_3]|nr:MAG: T9SS type A sorting domain-containing protein [Sphingobacteriales bacterium JAD_PAG50586_3]